MKGEYVVLVSQLGYITDREGTRRLRISDICLHKGFADLFLVPPNFLQIP